MKKFFPLFLIIMSSCGYKLVSDCKESTPVVIQNTCSKEDIDKFLKSGSNIVRYNNKGGEVIIKGVPTLPVTTDGGFPPFNYGAARLALSTSLSIVTQAEKAEIDKSLENKDAGN